MIIGQIKEVLAANLHKATSDYVKGSGGNQVDLLLLALNNARKTAEKAYDFSICRKRGYFSYSGTAFDWRSPTWFTGTGTARKIKTWYQRVSGSQADGAYGGVDRILRALTQEQVSQLHAREDYQVTPFLPAQRYASDAIPAFGFDPLLGQRYVILEGFNAFLSQTGSESMLLIADAFIWHPDWTTNSDTDWWTDNGTDFLIYQAMVEANRLTETFVGNVDGNLPPPVKEAQAALAALVKLDIDSVEGSIFISDL